MSKPIKLAIPKPCHEDWDRMDPDEKGRHCAACQKTVVDFTNMSDAELHRHLSKAATNSSAPSICGRLMPDQLNRTLIGAPPIGRIRWHGWQWMLTTLLLAPEEPPSHPTLRPPKQEQHILQKQVPLLTPLTDTIMETSMTVVGNLAVVPIFPDSLANASDTLLKPPVCTDTVLSEALTGVTGEVMITPADHPDTTTTPDTTILAPGSHQPDPETHPDNTLTIYPNPMPRGSSCHIKWPSSSGAYQLTLFTTTGFLVQQRSLEITIPQQITQLELPPNLAAGIYFLRAIHSGESQPYTTKLIVQ